MPKYSLWPKWNLMGTSMFEQLINALFKEAQKERDNAQKMMKDVSGDIQKER